MGIMRAVLFLPCILFLAKSGHGATDCAYTSVLLSYTFSHRTRVIPNFEPFIITPEDDFLDILLLPLNVSVNRFFSADEVGTHVDVAGRFHVDGYRIGEIGFCDFFLVPAIKIDVSAKAARDRNYEVTVDDIEQWICENGPLPERAIVIFDFGWSYRYDDARRYFGDDSLLDIVLPLQYSWPGISLEAAEFLVQCSSKIIAIGVDSPGVDTGFLTSPAESIPPAEPTSRYLTRYGLYLIENLQLRSIELPNRGFFLTVGVLNLQVMTAAPAYVIAEYCADPTPILVCPAATYETVAKGQYPYTVKRPTLNTASPRPSAPNHRQLTEGPRPPISNPRQLTVGPRPPFSNPSQLTEGPRPPISNPRQLTVGPRPHFSNPRQLTEGPRPPISNPHQRTVGSRPPFSNPRQLTASPRLPTTNSRPPTTSLRPLTKYPLIPTTNPHRPTKKPTNPYRNSRIPYYNRQGRAFRIR